jgi:hypothetical protein
MSAEHLLMAMWRSSFEMGTETPLPISCIKADLSRHSAQLIRQR